MFPRHGNLQSLPDGNSFCIIYTCPVRCDIVEYRNDLHVICTRSFYSYARAASSYICLLSPDCNSKHSNSQQLIVFQHLHQLKVHNVILITWCLDCLSRINAPQYFVKSEDLSGIGGPEFVITQRSTMTSVALILVHT